MKDSFILSQIGKALSGKDDPRLDGLSDKNKARYLHLERRYQGLNTYFDDPDFPFEEWYRLRSYVREKEKQLKLNEEYSKLEDFFIN
ncbi:MAG: hypothetical protein ACOCQA_00350 [bacterium]